MGSNNNLAGAITGARETDIEVRGIDSRSDRSKPRRLSRGAPPSSLSQPFLTDRSRSSSPSKSDRNSSFPTQKSSSSTKTLPTSSSTRPSRAPFNKHLSWSNHDSTPSLQRGKSGSKGRAVTFHQLLPRATTSSSPAISSFQPQSSSPTIPLHSSSSYRAFEFKTSAPVSPTTNVNVTGEILPPSSISQQINIASVTTADNPSALEDVTDNTSMSCTAELTSTQTFRPGSERGYDHSPMARLLQQYKEDSSDDDTSTWQRATTLSSKRSLLSSDIVERRGAQSSYSLRPILLDEVTRVVSELQAFLERTSSLIPERTSHFKVDPRDTFLSILKESSDLGQIHAAWMGLIRRMALAQENLIKYEAQYKRPIEGENSEIPLSPLSTDIGIYEAIEEENDKDFRMRYIYENVPHHQDQIHSPRKLRDGTAWSSIISLPTHTHDSSSITLPTIPEQEQLPDEQEVAPIKRDKGKRRITDDFTSPPTSPRVLNVGYGTPFKSSSQFFVRPGIPLPPSETSTQKNVLLGLGLPRTPAFESISSTKAKDPRNSQRPLQSRASNPFEGREAPPHMTTLGTDQNDDAAYVPPSSNHQRVNSQSNTGGPSSSDNHQQRRVPDNRSEGGSSSG